MRRGVSLIAAALGAGMVLPCAAAADDVAPLYKSATAPLEERVEDLLVRLTRNEKISLMAGGSAFATQPIARLGIPSLNFSDGPNGVRSNSGQPATVFPTGSALAATWNPALVRAVGEAIGREALAMNVQVMLGPNVNIQRSPLAGRNFETYSEDPYLAGKLGGALVLGIQSQGVGTSVKHFVGNEQELDRSRSSSEIDERTLREIYLRPFEMIVKEAKPWTIMASYNRLNGTYMTDNERLIRQVLKGEWGFDGLLMSDWGAVHSTQQAASAGLDLEMPGPARYFGPVLARAVLNWQVPESAIDDAARRMLRLILRSGLLDRQPAAGELLSPRNHAAALAAAVESVVLLKNEGAVLPLERARIHTLAVIGPNADVPLYQGGGSASVVSAVTLTPLESLRKLLGPAVRIDYAQGADNDRAPPPIDPRLLSHDAARREPGLASRAARPGQRAALEGFLWPPRSGTYEFSLSQLGNGTLWIDGRPVIGADRGTPLPAQIDFGAPARTARIELAAGRSYRLRVEYLSPPDAVRAVRVGLRLPPPAIAEAVELARRADAAVVFVGSSRLTETEGRDRADMELEGTQNELVRAVLAANPRAVVVLQNGAPLALPWARQAAAILEAGFAGETAPEAIARLLFGEANPSGKLPYTFPRRLVDNPAYLYYSAGREAHYGEGVFVGYRYYDKREVEPLFEFGRGLSYTSFEYSNLKVPASVPVGSDIPVSLEVRNTGARAGSETVELYVGDAATTEVVRPLRELKAFAKTTLAPGEHREVGLTLSPLDLAYYDVTRHAWTSTPGTHTVYVGSSSRDIRLQESFEWRARQDPRAPASEPRPSPF